MYYTYDNDCYLPELKTEWCCYHHIYDDCCNTLRFDLYTIIVVHSPV